MTARRILMTADAVGGVWTYALSVGRALRSHGVEITLAVMGPSPSEAQRTAARAAGAAIVDHPFALEWMSDPWDDVERAGEWLLAIERECAPDVVHVNGFAHASLGFRAPVVIGAHSCVCTWWAACRGGEPDAFWDRYRREVRRGLRAARAVVAPTRAMLDAFRDAHDPERRCAAEPRVIANVVDPAPPHADLGKAPFVLGAGRVWDEAKDLALLDAVARDLPFPVVIAGSDAAPGGARRPLERALALGQLERAALARWMGHAACFASPARYEPFGLAVLEAALSGCALVLSDLASFREVWGDVALFVPPGDAGCWREVLESVVLDFPRAARLGAQARARALEIVRPGRFAREHLELYDAVIAGASRSGEVACA